MRFPSQASWSFRFPTIRLACVTLALLLGSAPGFAQNINTVAGTGTAGFSGEGVAASTAEVRFPSGAVVDSTGNIYFADTANHRVRKITPDATPIITTVAGSGAMGFSGDGNPATGAMLAFPSAVALDSVGNLYIADTGNSRIRKVTGTTITTVAGDGTADFGGDGGLATVAKLFYPTGVVVDSANNIYIADTYNNRIRRVEPGGFISTFAGTGAAGFAGEDSSPTTAMLNHPMALALRGGGLFVADTLNHRVRNITSNGSVIYTVAGTGVVGTSGDGGSATSARLDSPVALTVDGGGNLYVADYGNHRVRAIALLAGGSMISAFAGTGTPGTSAEAILAATANLNQPKGVAAYPNGGGIFIADSNNQKVRRVGDLTSVPLSVIKSGTGGGTVTGAVATIGTTLNCGAHCLTNFNPGTVVTLTAVPNGTSTFTGWSGGGCPASSADPCDVTVSAPASVVTAIFTAIPGSVRLINISTRAFVQLGDNVTIAGFAISGNAPKKVLILARGPSLVSAGLTGTLSDPKLTLVNQSTGLVLTTNDDWQVNNPNAAEIQALGKAPSDTRESAILATLSPGSYTSIMEGSGARTGIAIVEVFEVDAPTSPLVNISTRGRVETGNSVMIAGFVIEGTTPQLILVRARGPSLSAAGVPNVLSDPQVTLVSQTTGQIVDINDNWGSQSNAGAITATGQAPTHPSEAAILVTLDPGAYTAVVSGVGGSAGVAIVEAFAQ